MELLQNCCQTDTAAVSKALGMAVETGSLMLVALVALVEDASRSLTANSNVMFQDTLALVQRLSVVLKATNYCPDGNW